jgi:hypothetical protein
MLEEVVIRNSDWRISVAVIEGSFLCEVARGMS